MRYWFNRPFNRSVVDRFCKELVKWYSKELKSVVNFIEKYDGKEDASVESFAELFSGLLKVGRHLESDITFELQLKMRMDLFTKVGTDFWILRFRSRQDIIGLVTYILYRYNYWCPRFSLGYSKGGKKRPARLASVL